METITYNGDGERIDIYLSNCTNYTRSFFHHIFERAGIKVNGKTVKKSYKLKKNDIIQIDDLERYLSADILQLCPKIDLQIRLEKPDYIVVYKPKGVLSHPGSVWDVCNPNIVGAVYHIYKDLPTISNFIRSGLVHRLDKETDGFMIIAKTEKGLLYFKNLFDQKSTAQTIESKEAVKLKKYYKAKVSLNKNSLNFLKSISLPYIIAEDVIPKIPFYGKPKLGITKILDVKFIDGKYAYLDIEILTGRTHQIRYHLSKFGMPIVGDGLYGGIPCDTMHLSNIRLEFEDPYNDYIIIQ